MSEHKIEMIRADEVSRTSAYSVIKELNRELADKGYMTVSGRVSKDYFEQRYFGWKDGIR